jgi:hypothetical protein
VFKNKPRCRRLVIAAGLALSMSAPEASAQTTDQPTSTFVSVLKQVAFDPTTYVPAILGYDATMRDWNSSQPMFRYGFVEGNPRFTVSGWPNDAPISYEAGKRRILNDALANLRMSVVDNLSTAVVEHVLVKRYPEHRKLIRTLGWVQRISLASYLSYQMSGRHYQQWRANEQLNQQLGIK